jgi:hypothetical protein
MAKKDKPPKKVKISRNTGKKLRQASEMPRGAEAESLLAKIAKALKSKNQ